MKTFSELQIGIVKGALLGPLAVFPAVLLLPLGAALIGIDYGSLPAVFLSTLFVGFWGVFIAYVSALIFGLPACLVLLRFKRLNYPSLSALALVPAVVTGVVSRDAVLTLMIAYFSLAVSSGGWIVGRKSIREL